MADTFQLEIVTPEKMVVKDVAEEIQIPGKDGYLGILPGHAPLITELAVGEISYRKGGQTHYLVGGLGLRRGASGQGHDPGRNRRAPGRDRREARPGIEAEGRSSLEDRTRPKLISLTPKTLSSAPKPGWKWPRRRADLQGLAILVCGSPSVLGRRPE